MPGSRRRALKRRSSPAISYAPLARVDLYDRLRSERSAVLREIVRATLVSGEAGGEWQERDSPSEDEMREMEYRHRELLSQRLRGIDEAVERYHRGGFGRCVECGAPIETKRLRCDPAVSLCFGCQTTFEQKLTEPERVLQLPNRLVRLLWQYQSLPWR